MRALPFALAATALLGATSAHAEPFGERGRNALVIDQLFGVASTKNLMVGTVPTPEPRSRLHLGVLGTSNVTRLGYHRFVRPWLSIGLNAQWASTQLEVHNYTTYGLYPRIGVVLPFSAATALWVRAGFGYLKADDQKSEDAAWNFTVGGEAFLVIAPVSHFGITIGPSFDGGLAGKVATQQNRTGDVMHTTVRVRTVAVSMGFVADF